jgi:hypothetical protein
MYGWTLTRGTQMIFFSIVHTMPIVFGFVVVALPFAVALLAQALVALARARYRERIGVSKPALLGIVSFLAAHLLLLTFYEEWSHVDALRVPVCLLGIGLLAVSVLLGSLSLSGVALPAASAGKSAA